LIPIMHPYANLHIMLLCVNQIITIDENEEVSFIFHRLNTGIATRRHASFSKLGSNNKKHEVP
ncbi:hypothetical protein, partial [Kurthia huakuii]|uniref:hypothetical protein n=1 Tax=Kurthia huakuii TaxID=1421019 RepID=UPI00056717C5